MTAPATAAEWTRASYQRRKDGGALVIIDLDAASVARPVELGWLVEARQRDRVVVSVAFAAFTRHALHGDGGLPRTPRHRRRLPRTWHTHGELFTDWEAHTDFGMTGVGWRAAQEGSTPQDADPSTIPQAVNYPVGHIASAPTSGHSHIWFCNSLTFPIFR
jgi:hypothetical protein